MSAQPAEPSYLGVTHEERRQQPLNSAVRTALHRYFHQLQGEPPDDLYRMVIEEVERPLLECTIRHCHGNQTQAAQCLGLNRGTLRKKLKRYDLAG